MTHSGPFQPLLFRDSVNHTRQLTALPTASRQAGSERNAPHTHPSSAAALRDMATQLSHGTA